MRSLVLAVLVCGLAAADAAAIVIRHDRDEASYRELAAGHPEVCRVGAGMGTLVAPRWVVTAAHVAEFAIGGGEVRFGERAVAVERAYLHPDYALEGRHRDLALLRLAEPVADIAPAVLYGGDDELGATVLFVGDGRTGDGRTGPAPGPRVLRAARNRVDGVRPGWISFTFEAPPAGDDLEGISGPGDSGGPALLVRDGVTHVLGVSAYNDGGELCTYGTREHYARIADERPWLDGVMSGRVEESSARRLLRHDVDDQGRGTVAGQEAVETAVPAERLLAAEAVARRLVAALNSERRDAFADAFSAAYREREGEEGFASLFEFVRGSRAVHGDIVSMHPLSDRGLQVDDGAGTMIPVVWHMADGMPGYFGLVLDAGGAVDAFSLFVRRDICRAGGDCAEAGAIGR